MTAPHNPQRPVKYSALVKDAPVCVLDFETTGVAGDAAAVEVALVRFEGGKVVGELSSRINPGKPIPPEASAVHGITDADVVNAPALCDFFVEQRAQGLLCGAQPAAYNAPFDHRFVPWQVIAHILAPEWPWLDPLVMVRAVDRYVRGQGRHRLSTSCARHGIPLEGAHGALADARAAGELLHKLYPSCFGYGKEAPAGLQLGQLLEWTLKQRAVQWSGLESYFARQGEA